MTRPKRRPTKFDSGTTDLDRQLAERRKDEPFKDRLARRLREDAKVLRRLAGND